jgi:hypothetical protein
MKSNYFFKMKELFVRCKTANRIKFLLFVCFAALSFNANAYSGAAFMSERLIYDIKWNQEKGRVEFKVIFYDNIGSYHDEYIKCATLYINNEKLGTLTVGKKTDRGDVTSSTPWNEICHPTNAEYQRANLFFYSHSASNNEHLAVFARGVVNDCGQYAADGDYIEIPINHSNNRRYTFGLNRGYDAAAVSHSYAEFFWYPGELTGDKTIEVALKDIVIMEENTSTAQGKPNVSRSVTMTRPAAPSNQSMTGGTIGADGQLTFTCSADGATEIQLLKGNDVIETKTGSNVTFTGKYLTEANDFLNGKTFSFNARKAISDNRTTYIWRSDINVESQRTGVFTNILETSLEQCGKIRLSWQIKNPSTTSGVNTDGFILEVKKGNDNWTAVTSGVPSYTAQNSETTNYNYTYTIPNDDLNRGTVNYQFHVKRAFVAWDDNTFGANYAPADSNPFSIIANLFQRNRSISINTDFKQLTGIEMKPGGTYNYPRLTWNMSTDGIECTSGMTLKLKVDNVEVILPPDAISSRSYQTTAADNKITDCTPQRYELILQYGTLQAVTYTVHANYVHQPLTQREFKKIEVSKGYYADRNSIKWTFESGYDNFTRFRLMRKEASQSDDEYVAVGDEITHTTGILQYNRDDREINAGVYYIYKVDGIYACDTKTGVLSSPTSVGFSQPYGSVSGRVTYTGSQAVKDVEINVATDNAMTANRELEFNSSRSDSYLSIPAKERLFNREGFGFEAWLKFTSSQADTIVSNSLLVITRGADSRITVKLNNASATVPTQIANGEYTHLTVTAEKQADYKHYTVKVYINDAVRYTGALTLSSDAITPTTATIIGQSFTGYIDDVRIWDEVLTAADVALNYDRVLGGNEIGLAAYYRFDEIDFAESALFDGSAVRTTFNGNHAVKGSGVNRSNIPVSASHLTIKGVTDDNGNYSIINCIPFTSEGTTYTLSPALGIHRFDPDSRPLYFSPNSQVFNNIDFTDISSFPVSGQIVYAGSNYPVEGVQIAIDGTVASKAGAIIVTDAYGKFTVDVPIGEHYITVSKQGHVFANGGRFPANALEKHNFQNSVSDLVFTDQTTVRIMGRVAGGNRQTNLPLGFGLSKANIGQAKVTLKSNSDVYRLNLTGADVVVNNNIIGGVTSRTTFKNPASGSIVEIETNPVTGEFLAVVPPVPFSITGIKTKDFEDTFVDGDTRDFECSKMVFDVNPAAEQTAEYVDSLNVKYTFVYHDSLKITRYNEPVINVSDLGAKPGAFGDSIYIYRNTVQNVSDTIRLYTVRPDGSVDYAFGYPLFSAKQNVYDWEISIYEEYLNRDDPSNPKSDIVPLAGQAISISNGLASGYTEFMFTNGGEQTALTASESTIELGDNGKKKFRFNTGFPKLGGDYLLAVKLSFDHNGKEIVWNNNLSAGTEFQGYLLGQVPSDGNNFVTKGPDMIDVVLPDPPGSYSFAYIEKGSSITSSHESTFTFETSEVGQATAHLGVGIRTISGIGIAVESKWEVIADLKGTAGGRQTTGKGNRVEKTLTFNETVNTSGDIAFVGSNADVYIGQSNNRVFGQVRQLSFYPKAEDVTGSTIETSDGKYSLFPKDIIAVGDEFATMFSYTQGHIVNTLIPDTKRLRNSLIRYYPGTLPTDTTGLKFIDEKGDSIDYIYLSNIPADNPNFGETGYYKVYYRPGLPRVKTLTNDVEAYNNWIRSWERAISDNEEAKIGLFDKRADLEAKGLMHNRSFNAGVNLAESISAEYNNVELKNTSDVTFGEFEETFGIVFNDQLGAEETFTVGRENNQEDSWEDGKSNSITFGFEISEDGGDYLKGTNDALTIDIYQPVADEMKKIIDASLLFSPIKTLRGYTFRTRAGQTSCPYEPADSTLFYKRDKKLQLLNYGTFQIEKPDLYINSSKSASAENIPSGREATFEVQMNNMSDAKDVVIYQLFVEDYSNLNGLVLSIDGMPLTEPREYEIEYGEEIVKTLKVRQSSQDVLEYKDVELILSSTCEESDITESSAKLSVTFVPSSSPVKLVSNSRLANVEGLNNGGKIRFTVSDYDRSYKNFGCIRLEYRSVTNENWTTLRTFVNDATLYPVNSNDKELITGPSHYYDFIYNATVPSDGEYIFRAVSVSKYGEDEITALSEEIHVVKDVKSPAALGYPSPVNGILNVGDEISVTFNEDIQSGKLVDGVVGSNFSITGVLNGDIREEPTSGIAFSGAQNAYTELPIYTNGSFSIETWFKRTKNTAGTLFAYGSGNEYISLGFDATGHAIATIGTESYTSTVAIDNADDTWKYIGLAYDRETGTVSVNAYQGTQNIELFKSKTFTQTPAIQGKLYLGNNATGNSGFTGAAALLHFYNFARTETQMSSTKSLNKSGTENGLIGLWELEEDEGALAKDKARSRHLTLNNTSRYIYPLGKSRSYNGTNQYTQLKSGTYPFGVYSDFTVEFWFKGGSQAAATLLSIGVDTYIGFDSDHRLTLSHRAEANSEFATQILAPAGRLDSKWHHFALSVKRNGSARASIDGVATATFNSSFFGDVGGGYCHLGAKYARNSSGDGYAYSEYFKGNIDELRVWNSALTAEATVYNKNYSLRGDESGLKAYYPFEKTTQVNGSIYSVDASVVDAVNDSLSIAGNAPSSDDSAPLQLARPVKNVPYTFTASNNKIVLNLTDEEYRLEGVTLYISVENVLDMRDNTSNTIKWIAYVNRNALNWNTDLVDITIEDGERKTFTVSISNSSGEKKDYFIEDLPSWLSVDVAQGTLNPLAAKELTFTVATGVNIGAYEAAVALTGTNSVREILPVSLKVTGNRPDWSVNPADFESSMTVVGQLQIKGFPQEDSDDLIAAFVGSTCVGLASPTYEKAYQNNLVYMQVWGNAADNGKDIVFKIWDASTGNIYPVVEVSENGNPSQIQFVGNSLKGSPAAPVIFNALDAVEQSMLLNNGWNWVSFNVDSPSLADVNELMTDINNGIEIKGQSVFSRYESGSNLWTNGTLNGTGLSNTQMYMLKMSGDNIISLPGSPLNVADAPITLYSGWNWISYIPQVNETVDEAFVGANPSNGDIVKSQTGFSIYDINVGWVGTLDYLRPGLGYMYHTDSQRSFNYPKTGVMTRSSFGDPTDGDPLTLNRPYTSLNSDIARLYETNLSLVGEVKLSSDYLSESARLIAIVGGERRGIAEIVKVGDRRLFFLPVYSNSANETVTFVLENNGKEIELRENIQYRANALVGTPSSPVLLTDANIHLKAYPNPFTDRITVSFEIAEHHANTSVKVELVSLTGATIYSTTYAVAVAGPQLLDLDGAAIGKLTEGMYIIRVTLDNGDTFTNTVIKNVY